jgi:CubicO group peptidase (beta-lactamase class C family)
MRALGVVEGAEGAPACELHPAGRAGGPFPARRAGDRFRGLARLAVAFAATSFHAGGAAAEARHSAEARPSAEAIVGAVADTYAGWALDHGRAVGIGIAVVLGDAPPLLFSYGDARLATGGREAVPFTPDTLFEIASNTKVFTTNLLGQAVAEGELDLSDRLGRFADKIGDFSTFKQGGLKRRITLGQLGSFTAGLSDAAPQCRGAQTPAKDGCLPVYENFWPPVSLYSAEAFLAHFAKRQLRDWQARPHVPVAALPAPYSYSNQSAALIGLLLGTPDGERISDRSVGRWHRLVEDKILKPLGMRDTFLRVPSQARHRVAAGYMRATAVATVEDGAITSITVKDGGGGYPPNGMLPVEIGGGGGSGAQATANVDQWGIVESVDVTSSGSGYTGGIAVSLLDPVTQTKRSVEAGVAVEDGEVSAVLLSGSVSVPRRPRVLLEGGQADGSLQPATAVARMVAGNVQFIEVTDGGAGYVEPLRVLIEPGAPQHTRVPIYAASGFLKASARDMARFLRAAMGEPVVEGRQVPPLLTRGFEIAQTPYACEVGDAALEGCSSRRRYGLSALAWQVYPGAGSRPDVITKNGALDGFSSQIMVVPELRLGVAVFATADSNTYVGDYLAAAVLYDLYFRCLRGETFCPKPW